MSGDETDFDYVAWFRDESMPPDDEDYEWPGGFRIRAQSAEAAQAWGDKLATTCLDTFLWSYVEPCQHPAGVGSVSVRVGQWLTAREIGW